MAQNSIRMALPRSEAMDGAEPMWLNHWPVVNSGASEPTGTPSGMVLEVAPARASSGAAARMMRFMVASCGWVRGGNEGSVPETVVIQEVESPPPPLAL